MARLLGPAASQRLVIGSDWKGGPVTYAGRTATVYTTAGVSVLASIATYDGTNTPGSVISGSTLTIGTDGRLPLFWLPDGADTVWLTVRGMQGVWQVNADWDARLDVVAGFTQADAVVDVAALTAAAAAGAAPDDDEFDALLADVTAVRSTVNGLLASLRDAGLLAAE